MNKFQRDVYDSNRGGPHIGTGLYIDVMKDETDKTKAEEIEFLFLKIKYGLYTLAHEDNSHDNLMHVTDLVTQLRDIALKSIEK